MTFFRYLTENNVINVIFTRNARKDRMIDGNKNSSKKAGTTAVISFVGVFSFFFENALDRMHLYVLW